MFNDNAYTEQIEKLSAQGIAEAHSIFLSPLDTISTIIRESENFDNAKNRLTKELADPEFIKNFGQQLFNITQAADAVGRSFVIYKDEYFSKLSNKKSARYNAGNFVVSASGMNWIVCADTVKVSFDLVPQEAVNYMREKSFSIAGVENQELLNAIQIKLEQALRDGQSYKEFASVIHNEINTMGYSGAQPFRLNTIYRTNLFSAYTIGQMEQVNQVADRFPYWRYVAIMDSRTRPEHAALNGEIFPINSGPIPPIDYNCRCSMQMLHIDEIPSLNIKPIEGENLTSFMSNLKSKTQVVRLDQKSAFDKWLTVKLDGMTPEVKKALAEALN